MDRARTLYDMRTNGRKRPLTTYDLARPHAAKRGYDRQWRDFRREYLRQYPLCVDCERAGRVRLAQELHHVAKVADRPDRRLDAENILGLCRLCHNRRTARGE